MTKLTRLGSNPRPLVQEPVLLRLDHTGDCTTTTTRIRSISNLEILDRYNLGRLLAKKQSLSD